MWNTRTNDYRYHIYIRKMKKLAMNKYGGIDVKGYTEYLSNLTLLAKLGQRFTADDIWFENPYEVKKPE